MYLNTLFLLIIITNLFLNNKTYLEVSMHKFTKILILCFLSFFLTGCVECTLLLDYSKTTSPKLETEFCIEEDTLKKYNMNIKEIKNKLLPTIFLNNGKFMILIKLKKIKNMSVSNSLLLVLLLKKSPP